MLSPCAHSVQRNDPERFTSVLFAPADRRDALWTLYAFNHELARAREVASAPMLALIRLQWWREVVDGAQRAHPVAQALAAALQAGVLHKPALHAMIEGREAETDDAPDEAAWRACLAGIGGEMMAEAGRLLGVADQDVLRHRGAGCAAVVLVRNEPGLIASGRWLAPIGRDAAWVRAEASAWLGAPRPFPRALLPALLPCVFARRALRGPVSPFGQRLAALAAMARGRA